MKKASSSGMTGATPVLLALLLCDQVIVDSQSGKKSLIGLFSNLTAANYPAARDMIIYAQLTDCQGKYQFKLELVNIEDDGVVAEGGMVAEVPNRLTKCDLVLNLPVPVPKPGAYEIRLFANDAYIGRVTFEAIQKRGG